MVVVFVLYERPSFVSELRFLLQNIFVHIAVFYAPDMKVIAEVVAFLVFLLSFHLILLLFLVNCVVKCAVVVFLIKRFLYLRFRYLPLVHFIPMSLYCSPFINISTLVHGVISLLFLDCLFYFVRLLGQRFLNSVGHLKRVHDWLMVVHLIFIH